MHSWCLFFSFVLPHHLLFALTGQQWNPLQGENDDTSEEAEGVLQPATGMKKMGHQLVLVTAEHTFESQPLTKHWKQAF